MEAARIIGVFTCAECSQPHDVYYPTGSTGYSVHCPSKSTWVGVRRDQVTLLDDADGPLSADE